MQRKVDGTGDERTDQVGLEVELYCSTYVAFSLSATTCGFEGSDDPTRGVTVEGWSIRFDNVPT